MKAMIERMRQYPVHTRKMIALSISFVFTGIIASMWLVGVSTKGTLALNVAPDSRQQTKQEETDFMNLASVIQSFKEQLSTDASVEVVESTTSSSLEEVPAVEATVIPF